MASRIAPIPLRRWLIRNVGWVAAAALVAAVGFLPTAPPVLGSAPPAHKVEICHATPPDTAANGWHMIEVDVASVGYQHSGHQDKHDADIIPPYSYDGFSFTGKNWTAEGQAIWANDCRAVTPTPTVTPTDEPTVTPTDEPTVTPTDEPTITPTDEPTETPTGNVLPTESAQAPTQTPTGNVLPAEGTPAPTLPPTDTTSATSGSVSMAALFLVIAMLAAVTGSLVTIDRSIRRVR